MMKNLIRILFVFLPLVGLNGSDLRAERVVIEKISSNSKRPRDTSSRAHLERIECNFENGYICIVSNVGGTSVDINVENEETGSSFCFVDILANGDSECYVGLEKGYYTLTITTSNGNTFWGSFIQ